jgi:hypothetical protein
VFKAEHRMMGRTAAIKFLAPAAAASEQLTARFERTVRILSRLEHPNLVRAYEAGQQGKTHYLVMEYVEGQDLRTIVRERGPLGVDEAVGYVVQAAKGLGYAHENGVWHRNVKPSNLMVDRQGTVKIVGFGLAHVEAGAVMDENSLEENLTRQGQVMGTYDFMSPEQAVDSSGVDHRADVYSLGCTLHSLLTGRPPYVAKSPVQQVLAHRSLPVPSLHKALPEISPELDRVFQKMMAKRPEDRYASMNEVVAELEACLASSPSAAAVAAAESTAEKLRSLVGLGAAPAQPAGQAGTAVKPPPLPARPLRRTRRPGPVLPIVIGGLLAVVVFVLAVQYFQRRKPVEVAQPASPQKTERELDSAVVAKTPQFERPRTEPPKKPAPQPEATPKPPAPEAKTREEPAVLELKPPEERPAPEAKTPETPTPKPPPKEPAPEPKKPSGADPERGPVPDKAARERALRLLHDTYQEELAGARTSEQKAVLARKMLREAQGISDDPAGRYMLLDSGCTLATEAGDLATALEAVGLTSRWFTVDGWKMKADLVADMGKGTKTPALHRALAEKAMQLTQAAFDARQFETAARLGDTAVVEAVKTREPVLIAKARAVAKDGKKALAVLREYETAKAELEQSPQSPKANLTAGRYECLMCGEWETGLRKLAAGSDAALRDLAKKDLAGPEDAEQQVAVGDNWWDLAGEESGIAQTNLYRRAAWWYQKALPHAKGLLKAKLEKRLQRQGEA